MKSTQLTQGTATLILGLYLIYGVFALPFAGVLVSLAIGLIAYGTLESLEMSVALAIVVGVLYTLIARSGAAQYAEKEQKVAAKEGFTDGASAIANRVARIKKASEQGPKGVYASAFVEGFADASTATNGTVQNPTAQTEMKEASAQSNPASAQAPSTAGSGIAPPPPPPVAMETKKPDEKQGFRGDSGTDGMFKLGVLPDEKKDGYHIDAGTTVVNALNALKPDQVKAMTEDTQKLIETQKSLLGMLSNMKPMLQDGKQMMETFQEMFGNGQLKL